MSLDDQNKHFMQAVAFVNQTNQPLFLTGKAGTGKTTFLKYISKHSYKKMAITAPTGVAAMNAGGTTLHALFWLPFGIFIEDYALQWNQHDNTIYNKSRLFGTIKLTKQRRALLQELELLVIDEVSMVRADMLDAIDVILKSVRRDMRPFGGLQVLFIGDLYQLPPVVKDEEWRILKDHYKSMFFFDSKVLRDNPPVMLELKKIYRQKDENFIDLLNNIRNNESTTSDFEKLNQYYQPDFNPDESEQFITLTSHNRIADQINKSQLEKLPGNIKNISAIVRNDFQSSAFPADETLQLKIQAQVMFIKNDGGEDRKYYNGKIGVVKEIDLENNIIRVGFNDGSEDVEVRREIWENIKYQYNKGEDKIESEVLGTFSQFPLRLAWAITIHKSQGLTFDRAIIDAGTSFAAGQVYVALSRLRGLDGLILKSKIATHAIRTDAQVVQFMKFTESEDVLQEILKQSQRSFLGQILLQSFKWNTLIDDTLEIKDSLNKRKIGDKDEAETFLYNLWQQLREQEKVANKFIGQLQRMLSDKENIDYDLICTRTKAAVEWFLPKFRAEIILPTVQHISLWSVKKSIKKYISEMNVLLLDYKRKYEQLKYCLTIAEELTKDEYNIDRILQSNEGVKDDSIQVDNTPEDKKDTKSISLEMYQDGFSISEIAEKRGLVEGTIYGHLIHFVGEEIEPTELISEDKLNNILNVLKDNSGKSSSEIKMILGEGYDYPDIKLAQKVFEIMPST